MCHTWVLRRYKSLCKRFLQIIPLTLASRKCSITVNINKFYIFYSFKIAIYLNLYFMIDRFDHGAHQEFVIIMHKFAILFHIDVRIPGNTVPITDFSLTNRSYLAVSVGGTSYQHLNINKMYNRSYLFKRYISKVLFYHSRVACNVIDLVSRKIAALVKQ